MTTKATEVLRLQRQAGNAAVAGVLSVQRAPIQVTRIDFNPVLNRFTDATVHEGNFYAAFKAAVQAHLSLGNYRGQLNNVIPAVRSQPYSAPDIEQLTTLIVAATRGAYAARNISAWPQGVNDHFSALVRAALVGNLTATAMDRPEQGAFDALATAAGPGAMSRSKGAPSRIGHGQLAADVGGHVTAIRDLIAAEHRRWRKRTWPYEAMTLAALTSSIAGRLKAQNYQGNHTNNAGWLPTVALPASDIEQIRDDIFNNASVPLQAALAAPDAQRRINRSRVLKQEYGPLRAAATAGYTDAQMREMAWAALGNGVSTYIEFHIPGPISRVMFEFVHHRFYVTAHYKWKDGYNPFFEVTGLPPL